MSLIRRMQVINGSDEPQFNNPQSEFIIKVGFATKDMIAVNQHFGSAKSIAVYYVGLDDTRFVEVYEFGKLAQDGNESKLDEKINALNGCAAVYCHAIGSSAVRQLAANAIQPIKINDAVAIKDIIKLLQDEMRSGPSSWLAKAIERDRGLDDTRFDQMEAEGWDG